MTLHPAPGFPKKGSFVSKSLLAAVLIVVACGAAITVRPVPASFCEICGARENQTSWAIRGTNVTLFQNHEVAQTPISELLTSKRLVAAHGHRWRVPRLVPNPLDEFVPSVVESLEFINAPRVVNFTQNVAAYADPASVARWKDLVLQPQYTHVIDGALRFLRVPIEGFADRTAFLAWWGQNSFAVYNRLREQTETD